MAKFQGPLRVSEKNPRYFTDDSGKAVYLTGSHVWQNLKDLDHHNPPRPFDYGAYLDLLETHHHNFIRMWTWEFFQHMLEDKIIRSEPHPWERSGAGDARDGQPKFDLSRFNEAYFERLRTRVELAGDRGIYVSIMLFEGWGLHSTQMPWCRDGHPFCKDNNVNGVDGDPDDTGRMLDCHMLKHRAVTAVQEAYVKKVIDTVTDLDNVLYEISNETGAYSTDWQYHLVRFIHDYEKQKPKQHPVGMTFQHARHDKGNNRALFDGPADWISPNPEGGYQNDPPDTKGEKVVLTDTDHLWGLGCKPGWVWKSFTRGLNPILMDPIFPFPGIDDHPQWAAINQVDHPLWEPIRCQMGDTRRYVERMDLIAMVPRSDLASSLYCLAQDGVAYVVHLPEGGTVTVDLSQAVGLLHFEWFCVADSTVVETGQVTGGGSCDFTAPFSGEAVLYLHFH